MQTLSDPKAFQDLCWSYRMQGVRLALVPTMGFFHAGHLSLMDWARANADKVAVSLFVNPTQFGPNEDLDAYPRDLAHDQDLAEQHGVDLLFTPQSGPPDGSGPTLYAPDHATWVETPALAAHLCGQSRPTHFRGVATVVTKLFMLAMPQVAVFGEKDWQQLALIRRMARDLNFPVRIEGRPIVREEDGLAMSSRNVYLSAEERALAPHLQKGLQLAADLVREGETDATELIAAVHGYYADEIGLGEVDYLDIVDADLIEPIETVDERALMAVAYRFTGARLIDNLLLPAPNERI